MAESLKNVSRRLAQAMNLELIPSVTEETRTSRSNRSKTASKVGGHISNGLEWEQACIARVRSGEWNAFDKLIAAYGTRIYTHLYRLVGNREEAEDLAQETFLRAYRYLDSYDSIRPFGNWLYAIATNVGLGTLRVRSRQEELQVWDGRPQDQNADRVVYAGEDGRAAAQRTEMRTRIAVAVGKLPPLAAALVHLHYYEGMTIREAAGIVRCTEDAAKVALHRARKRLRLLLEEDQ
ncbi:MAG: RNA polymerase sigma factor [Candidatus Hydrogenedentes bacterium]|nr:RNA polymerase sigma factor [Candidatus Hydrogenedentota bacterium]